MKYGKHSLSLVWLRRDLRLYDHAALALAEKESERIAVCFVFDTPILRRLEDTNDRRVTFIHESLLEIDASLKARGSMLIVRHGDPVDEIPALTTELHAACVYANRDYEPYARTRDEAVRVNLQSIGIHLQQPLDHVVIDAGSITTGQGMPYKVFTPYKRAWYGKLYNDGNSAIAAKNVHLGSLAEAEEIRSCCRKWDLALLGFKRNTLWLTPGESAGRLRLKEFMTRIDAYDVQRDVPSIDGTSGLSVHLRFGTVSIRDCFRRALKRTSIGAETWVSELIWREFYHMILDRFPHVATHAFKMEFDGLIWEGNEEHFRAWREGRTGYPLVDAAMRHFNRTGWMHNRLRMIVAMFLAKDLLIDWKLGEAYFARHLLDYDLAANNGGWQWCASTGVDAQPYFRVFNPVLQSKRFDPEGAYISEQVPELRGFGNSAIHFPASAASMEQAAARCLIGKDYPLPIVDHAVQKEKAIRMFKR